MERLHSLLARLDGPGFRSREDRDEAVAELRAMGPVALREAIEPLLTASDLELRCQAGTAAMMAEAEGWQDLVLSLFEDPEGVVRWHACGLLYDAGDVGAVCALVRRLQSDPDTQVRVIAADALGRIGCPAAISGLEETAVGDHAVDRLGYTPAGAARESLATIGTGRNRK